MWLLRICTPCLVTVKGTALRKTAAYIQQDNGKLKRVGYFKKGRVLKIHGIGDKHLLNSQKNEMYWLRPRD